MWNAQVEQQIVACGIPQCSKIRLLFLLLFFVIGTCIINYKIKTNKMGSSTSRPVEQPKIATKWYNEYVPANIPSECFKGKTVAITGCTSGTGYVLAEACVTNGAENVLLLNRSSERADSAQSKLQNMIIDGSKTKVETIPCDLQDFDSVRKAAETIKTKYDSVDVLCNNAGVMALEDVATKDGYDIQMQTNHLSHFLLTKELFPLILKAKELRGEARIVNHSSVARDGGPLKEEYFGKNGGNLGGNAAGFMVGSGPRWDRYHQTKLANMAFTLELCNRINESDVAKGVKSVVAAPGLSATNLQVTSHANGGMSASDFFIFKMGQSQEDGTMPLLQACFGPTTMNGDFWEPNGFGRLYGIPKKMKYDKNSLDPKQRLMLWTKSEEACGEFKV